MKPVGPHGWYRVEDRLIAVVGPLALQVLRVGSLWEGTITTIGHNEGVLLARSGKYRSYERAQRATQDLAKDVLAGATASLAALKLTVTGVPRA